MNRRPPMTHTMSSNVRSFGYDFDTLELWVSFRNTPGYYVYEQVPPIVAQGLRVSESKGSFLHQNVLNHYRARLIDDDGL